METPGSRVLLACLPACLSQAKCSFGIVSGTMALNSHMDALKQQLDSAGA
jgi:hypothetical protein|eukprot:COSAG01_NODE_3105_length_6577_cov_4.068077_2_plen_50_part_00